MGRRSIPQMLRQHHALEHATVTILSRRLPGVPMMARSDLDGFTLFGDVDTEEVRLATEEALQRLQRGESSLAIHPNCGTNLVTAGMLSGVAAVLASAGRTRSFWDRIPAALLAATLALIVAVPTGRWVQENVTTSPEVNGLRVDKVQRFETGALRHRVAIRS
jgi:hypothetical protein